MESTTGWVAVVNIFTFVWVLLWTLAAAVQGFKNRAYSVIAPMTAFFFFNGFPLILDIVVGRPDYYLQPGFEMAASDPLTSFIYCMYMWAVPLLLWFFGKPAKNHDPIMNLNGQLHSSPTSITRSGYILIYAILLLPVFMLFISPQPTAYLQLGWREWYNRANLSSETIIFGSWLARAALMSISASAALLYLKERLTWRFVLLLAAIVCFDFVITSMRHPIAYAIVLWLFVFWRRGYLKGRRLLLGAVAALTMLMVFSNYFVSTYRTRAMDDTRTVYSDLRIDFGRDDVIKMAIYAELYPQKMQILDYRGQSILYSLFIFVPRSIWVDKPYSYAEHFTAAMRQAPVSSSMITQQGLMTTSWLEEAIANFGWFGLVIGPLLPAFICRIGDSRAKGPFGQTLTFLVATLFMAVQLPAFYPMFALWVLSLLFGF